MSKQQNHRYCPKRRFRDPKECKSALRAARMRREAASAEGRESRRQEIRWYLHWCGAYHLTSEPLAGDLQVAA